MRPGGRPVCDAHMAFIAWEDVALAVFPHAENRKSNEQKAKNRNASRNGHLGLSFFVKVYHIYAKRAQKIQDRRGSSYIYFHMVTNILVTFFYLYCLAFGDFDGGKC